MTFVNICDQFFLQFPGIGFFADRMANRGKWVIISALNGSGKAGFRNVHSLMSLCENIIFLKAVCMICRDNDGAFTIRRHAKKVTEIESFFFKFFVILDSSDNKFFISASSNQRKEKTFSRHSDGFNHQGWTWRF